jgi:hypothetical protein
MKAPQTIFLALLISIAFSANANELEGGYLYKVSTVRAETGSLSNLLVWVAALKSSDYFEDAGIPRPLVMRHSQGDQWDLMIISPMDSWTRYYSADATAKRQSANAKHTDLLAQSDAMIAFDVDHFALGPAYGVLSAAYKRNAFYHIEMFSAAAGKTDALFEQRKMENSYLSATGQTANMIFRRAAGSDIDVFTIGFHRSLEAFAAPGDASDDDKEQAAIAAGFKNRADISFYLRSLISGHHDTLAVRVD